MTAFTVPGRPVPSKRPPVSDLDRAISLVLAAGGLDYRLDALRIEGEPIAKARARYGKGHRLYTPKGTVVAEETIAWVFKARKGEPFVGNVAVGAVFYRSNRHRIDLDNLLKTILDGITKSGVVWKDDEQVTALVGVVEYDPDRPRTAIAIAPHQSTLLRGEDKFTHTCETCGSRYRPHAPKGAEKSRFCSRACRATRSSRCICVDCGGPTSAPHVKRCRECYAKYLLEGSPA